MGGDTWLGQKCHSKSTEILHLKDKKWVLGPELPLEIKYSSCVALPPTSNFACVIIGGWTKEECYSSKVYGLNESLTEWLLLGNIRTRRRSHIALPLS